ncbi:Predicted transporter (major facilitator superfamily) [Phaffia rhodozyma]|uniref:Predicted transporter (Major facilitator superfamily) n=1 Tax=Phaffia rhodozyma TaxID=264483 RepID=A0A0F7STV7_PHARH|nr:Predicted transporter (major facilitator superfamily) [Phaffia rhodozyma]
MENNERTPLLIPVGAAAVDASAAVPGDLSKTRFRLLMAGLWTMTFVAALDGTIVATLVSSIGSSFSAMESAGWIGTSYLLASCCFTPLYGRLCDIFGRKGSIVLAGSLFASGTLLCGLAANMKQLIVFRFLAGMGGGGFAVVGSVIVSDIIPLKQRGLYQGYTNLLFGLGGALGAPLGGFISDTIGWRAAFLGQMPLLISAVSVIFFNTKEPASYLSNKTSTAEKLKKIDYLGSFTLVTSVGSLCLALSLKTKGLAKWSDGSIWGMLLTSAVSMVAFVLVEWKFAVQPVLPMGLLGQRTALFSLITNFLLAVVTFSILYNIPLFFTAVRLTSNAAAGAHLITNSASVCFGSLGAGWYMRHTGKYWKLQLIAALGPLFSTIVLATVWDYNTPEWILNTTLIPAGLGFSCVITTTLLALISSVERENIPVATGMSYLSRTTGQVIGVSLSATASQAILEKSLRSKITGEGSTQIINDILHSIDYIRELPAELQQMATDSWATSLRYIFVSQAILSFILLVCLLPIREHPLPDSVDNSTPTQPSTPVEERA